MKEISDILRQGEPAGIGGIYGGIDALNVQISPDFVPVGEKIKVLNTDGDYILLNVLNTDRYILARGRCVADNGRLYVEALRYGKDFKGGISSEAIEAETDKLKITKKCGLAAALYRNSVRQKLEVMKRLVESEADKTK